jgi:hypothetical protein
MKRLTIFAAFIIAAVIIFQLAYPNATVRYRLTLEADVDGKPSTGSGVVEVTYRANPQLLGASAEFVINVRGEAVALDLGQRGTLFALLTAGEDSRSGPEWIVLRAFNFPGGALPSPMEKGISDVRKLSGKVELSLESLALLVRFRDTNDPITVEKVDPLNLDQSFGPGVKLKRATLEMMSDGFWPFSWFGITGVPVTREIDQKLPWVSEKSSIATFWRALYSSGFRPNGSIEPKMLLTQP